LAAWRLYRGNRNNCEAANKFASAHRKSFKNWPEIYATCKKVSGKLPYKPGDPRPFHNSKKLPSIPTNQADLFSCDDDYRHAKMRVIGRLSESYYRESRKQSPAMAKFRAALEKLSRRQQPAS
jgi:hypothetical protein